MLLVSGGWIEGVGHVHENTYNSLTKRQYVGACLPTTHPPPHPATPKKSHLMSNLMSATPIKKNTQRT